LAPSGIHDREPFHPPVLRPGFGDVGDAAVEERAFAGQARVDRVGAFVRGAAPVARSHHEALARQLGLQRHVVQVAADRQLPVAVGADEAVHERHRPGARPMVEGGVGDFGIGDGADAAGAARLEQAAAAQVGDDHLGNLPPERIGGAGGGAGALRRRQRGHGDDHVVAAFVGDVDTELSETGCGESGGNSEQKSIDTRHWESLLSKRMGLSSFQAS
jgi:hypothetical protein